MPKVITEGWVSPRDLTNQCGTPCHWVLKQRSLVGCEFGKPEFPHATHCKMFVDGEEDDE